MGLGGLVESRRGRCGMNEWDGVGALNTVSAVFKNTRFLTTVTKGILFESPELLCLGIGILGNSESIDILVRDVGHIVPVPY